MKLFDCFSAMSCCLPFIGLHIMLNKTTMLCTFFVAGLLLLYDIFFDFLAFQSTRALYLSFWDDCLVFSCCTRGCFLHFPKLSKLPYSFFISSKLDMEKITLISLKATWKNHRNSPPSQHLYTCKYERSRFDKFPATAL